MILPPESLAARAKLTDHALLTADEELELTKSVEKARNLRQRIGPLTLEELKVVEAGLVARENLITRNTRLVVSILKSYLGRGIDFDDLFQEGVVGLTNAIDRFEWQRGYKLSTYATWWIKQSLSRTVADKSRIIRLPVHMYDMARKIVATQDTISQKEGRTPTLDEIAAEVNLSPGKVKQILEFNAISLPSSLDKPYGKADSDGDPLLDVMPTPETDVSAPVENKQLKEEIDDALDKLSPRERRVLEMRFELNGYNGTPHTLKQCGEKFGLTRERIRQIEADAIRKLRHPRRSRKLRGYLKD